MWKKIKKSAVKVFLILFHPASPIITLLIGWFLTLLATVPSIELPSYVSYFITKKTSLMIYIVGWLVLSVIFIMLEDMYKTKEDEIKRLQVKIEEKDRYLDQSAGIIMNKYGEFSTFQNSRRFNNVLKSFVENNPIVESAQIYKYSSRKNKNDMEIRVKYEEGYAYDGVDINCIYQTYYKIDYDRFIKTKNIIKLWKRLLTDYDIMIKGERETVEKYLFDEITQLFINIHTELNRIKRISDITEMNFTEYRLLTLLLRLMRSKSATITPQLVNNKAIEEYLTNGKRTGILGSILLDDAFMFSNTGKTAKFGRMYFCFPAEIFKQKYIVVFSIMPSDLDDREELEKEMTGLKEDFGERFSLTA